MGSRSSAAPLFFPLPLDSVDATFLLTLHFPVRIGSALPNASASILLSRPPQRPFHACSGLAPLATPDL